MKNTNNTPVAEVAIAEIDATNMNNQIDEFEKKNKTTVLANEVIRAENLAAENAKMKQMIADLTSKPRKEKVRAAKGNGECARRIAIASDCLIKAKNIREKQGEIEKILTDAGMDSQSVKNAIMVGNGGAISMENDARRNLTSVMNAMEKVFIGLKEEKNLDNLLESTRDLFDIVGHLIPSIAAK